MLHLLLKNLCAFPSARVAQAGSTLLMLGSMLLVAPAQGATFTPTMSAKTTTNTLYYQMTGPIVMGDAVKLQGLLDEKKVEPGKTNVWLHLDARGGDLEEAFRIGRLLRKYNAYTSHGQCVGSCVYAFMGGSTRQYTPFEPQDEMSIKPPDKTGLWVYEPYVMAKVLPMVAANPKIAQALKNVKDYTVEMTGKTKFYDSVTKIPYAKPIRMSSNNVFDMNVCSFDAQGTKTKQTMPVSKKRSVW